MEKKEVNQEPYPDFDGINRRIERYYGGRNMLFQAGKALEIIPMLRVLVDQYRERMVFVDSIRLDFEHLKSVERLHLEFKGGQGFSLYPYFEKGSLRLLIMEVRRSDPKEIPNPDDVPLLQFDQGNMEISIHEPLEYGTHTISIFITPPILAELEQHFFDPGRIGIELLKKGVKEILREASERLKGFIIQKSQFPTEIKVGDRLRIGKYYREGFSGYILPECSEIGIVYKRNADTQPLS